MRNLTEELAKANETINFLTSVTGQDPSMIKRHLEGAGQDENKSRGQTPPRSVAEIEKEVKEMNR